jgi:MSHA biogenesis protein MshQ
MGQPFEHVFSVEAFNSLDEMTENYGLFGSLYIVDIDYRATTSTGDSLIDRIADGSLTALEMNQLDYLKWSGTDWASTGLMVSIPEFYFTKAVNTSNISATVVDGPITSLFGLKVTRPVDDVDFGKDGAAQPYSDLLYQPDFRYGRAVLKDVSGNTNAQITVPFTAQYWDGSRFVANAADSGSEYRGNKYCIQTQWRSDGAQTAASMQTTDTVEQGYGNTLNVEQGVETASNIREQVRIWLRLGQDTTAELKSMHGAERCSGGKGQREWLQYDWESNGDQDPSTFVTFGTYRGNDRIIFRGEPGLTGF